ncbi:LuxR family transcriptional regulator [Cellulomonas sp. ES6]|uniref:LuxR C-terminal-related transcriptional regulator n=1 Tax=Cellulomonas sp. ES6 TaxID=3039384 RepID=UPI0024B79DF2|nr:LuxR family transcriptional regulator [Cellulomonas sp. ES6]WHP16261.1 LuxR C-terminal-related transcriptional regulator [Cellulomonas sp. ES6]
MVLDALNSVAAAALRWLALGRDVVVRGDTGSGRSTVLGVVARQGERQHLGVVVADWHDLAGRVPSAGARPLTPAGRSDDDVAADLVADLGARGVLLVDDVDELDDATLEVLGRVLRRSRARFVATATRDLTRLGRPSLSRLVAARAPAEVRVPPLGFQAMARMVADRLDGPVDAALTSSVTAWSAGNPAVAAAMVDAAQFAGTVGRRDDVWTAVGDLDDVPLDAVAHLMTAGLPPGAQDALDVLAVLGPAPSEVVHRLVPDADLSVLVARGRVVSYGGDSGLLAVSPPALARAVRDRLSGPRRLDVARLLVPEAGHELPLPSVRTGLTDMIVSAAGDPADSYWRWAAELTGLVHERSVVTEAAARGAWEERPEVATALPYLMALLRRPATDRVRDVVDGTVRDPGEDPQRAATFDDLCRRWRVWQRSEDVDPAVDPGVAVQPRGAGGAAAPGLRSLVAAAVAGGGDDEALLSRLALPGPDAPEPGRSLAVLSAASVLLEAGRPGAVLRLTTGVRAAPWMPGEVDHAVAGLRGMALLLLDRVVEAEARSRALLEAAYDRLDAAGIRIHSLSLAHALTVRGQWTAAWRVLSTALRLGPPGPLGGAFYRRSLTLSAMLAALMRNSDVARMLATELRHAPPLHEPVVDSVQGVAEAYLLLDEGRTAEADALMWRFGDRCRLAGRPMLALEYWALRVEPSTPEQVRQMRELSDRVPLPLFAPLVDLHAALLGDDLAELDRAARAARLEMVPGLAPRVLEAVNRLRESRGLPPLADPEVDDLLGEQIAEAIRSAPPVHRSADLLSDREHEIAVLAAQGMTNREIAVRLHLSTRTVENHVHRVLGKLGLRSRSRLAEVLL